MKISIWCFSPIIFALAPAIASAQWIANGRDAMYTMYFPQAKKADTNAIFIISYEKKRSCVPIASLLFISGKKLGAAKNQDTVTKRDSQLSVTVDGNEFTGPTVFTQYTNAIELAMNAPVGMVDAMIKKKSTLIVSLGIDSAKINYSEGGGFESANEKARVNCN